MSWLFSKKGEDIEENITREKYRGSISNTPLGLYLYGDVGSGKTFLMDLFYSSCNHITRKRRIHFHNFMVEVHDRLFSFSFVFIYFILLILFYFSNFIYFYLFLFIFTFFLLFINK